MTAVAVCLLVLVTVVCSAQFHQWGGKRDDISLQPIPMAQKRNGFNSWGGKRAGFNSWGGKRAGFNSWGGKRSDSNLWSSKSGEKPIVDTTLIPLDGDEGASFRQINMTPQKALMELLNIINDEEVWGVGNEAEEAGKQLKTSLQSANGNLDYVVPFNFLISKLCNRRMSSQAGMDDKPPTLLNPDNNTNRPFCSTFLGLPMDPGSKQASFNPWGGKRSPNNPPLEKPSSKKQAQTPEFFAWGGKRTPQLHPLLSTFLSPPMVLENQMT